MPFKSEQQRRFMFSQHPDIAHKWAHGEHSTSGKTGHRMPKKSGRGVRKAHRKAKRH